MRIESVVAAIVLSVVGGAAAQAQTVPPLKGLIGDAFAHPDTSEPTEKTTFTPASSGNLFTEQLVAKISAPERKQAMRLYAGQVNQMVESAYAAYGYPANDVGVALAGFLETAWEMNHGTFKIGGGTAHDKAQTEAVVRQMQNALLTRPAYKNLPDKTKQTLYEASTFMMGHLATQWQQAGSDSTKLATVKQQANEQLQTLFGIKAGALTRKPDGTFVSVGTVASSASKAVGSSSKTATGAKAVSTPVTALAPGKPLPAASAHGARVFVKYTFTGTTTRFDQLILFPGGAAFTDIPGKPVSQFDEATLRASLKPFDIGTWKQSGNTLIVTLPNAREKVTTLHKVPRGWYDGDKADPDDSYNTYFPVIPVTPAQITGAWKSQSLTTMGFAGGAAPMVAAGSNSARTFHANGTFTGGKKSFASATTANQGDAFKSGGDVGVYNTKNGQEGGRWRLDGPLLTLESGGKRTVALAYILPHWKKSGPPDLLIDGDWWQRPDND